jgi:hypothetical protein
LHGGIFVNAETRPDGFKAKVRKILQMENRAGAGCCAYVFLKIV